MPSGIAELGLQDQERRLKRILGGVAITQDGSTNAPDQRTIARQRLKKPPPPPRLGRRESARATRDPSIPPRSPPHRASESTAPPNPPHPFSRPDPFHVQAIYSRESSTAAPAFIFLKISREDQVLYQPLSNVPKSRALSLKCSQSGIILDETMRRTNSKVRTGDIPESYLALVKRHPLTSIRIDSKTRPSNDSRRSEPRTGTIEASVAVLRSKMAADGSRWQFLRRSSSRFRPCPMQLTTFFGPVDDL